MKRSSLTVVGAAFLGVLSISSFAAAEDAPNNRIYLEISGLRSNNGSIRCALYANADAFPRDISKAVSRGTGGIKDNHAVDTNILGIPKEGLGASNNARGSMGPPKFSDARFEYKGGSVTLKLTTAY